MLVIFDCDGVLVDSEKLASAVFSDALATLDISLSADECFRLFHGKTLPYCYKWIAENYMPLPKGFDELIATKTTERFETELNAVAGIPELLSALNSAGVPFCVASNGGHKKINSSLRITALESYFPYRFSADDVVQGKPAPDLFLLAAHHFKKAPTECWVVEDSQTGIAAAKAAAMNVVKYDPDFRADNAAGDEEIDTFASMGEIKAFLFRQMGLRQ